MKGMVVVDRVSKQFGPIPAVQNVSLEVRAGEVFALLGPNGAGKSTLIRMLMGLQRPDRGRIEYRLDGGEPAPPDPGRLGYLPEDRGLYPDVTVIRTLVYFGVLRGMRRGEARSAALAWLERMSLLDRCDEPLKSLSKGNQQKVQFISAILHAPRFAVLDEPFSGLDPVNQEKFLELIRDLRERGTTVLLSAHQMSLVERLADRIMVLNHGRPVLTGTLAEIRRRWATEERLVLRLAGSADPAPLARHAEVLRIEHSAPAELTVYLRSGAPLGPLLATAGAALDVREVHSAPITLHEAYVRAIGGGSPEAETPALLAEVAR